MALAFPNHCQFWKYEGDKTTPLLGINLNKKLFYFSMEAYIVQLVNGSDWDYHTPRAIHDEMAHFHIKTQRRMRTFIFW